MELEVAMIYARALYTAAVENKCVQEIRDELLEVDHIFRGEKDFQRVLVNPAISSAKKREMVESVFKGKIRKELLNFLYILVDKGRLYGLHKMAKFYYDLDDEARGEGYGVVYSVYPLNTGQMEKLEDEAGKLFKKKIHLNNKIDKKIIGGVKLLVEGKIIDATIQKKLNRINRSIIKVR